MAEEKEKEKEQKGLSRREFLKDAGLVVGGAAVGSIGLVSACGGAAAGSTATITKTATVTVTSPGGTGAGPTVTTTVTKSVDPRSAFNVNGKDYKIDIQPYWSLNFVLREQLGLTFTKIGCDRGECGHCTVLVDGLPVYSCMYLAVDAAGKKVETAESLAPDLMTLSPIAKGFRDNEAFQCGFCTAGFMIATKALLAATPKPTIQQVKEGLAGHVCVCTALKEVCETVVKIGAGG